VPIVGATTGGVCSSLCAVSAVFEEAAALREDDEELPEAGVELLDEAEELLEEACAVGTASCGEGAWRATHPVSAAVTHRVATMYGALKADVIFKRSEVPHVTGGQYASRRYAQGLAHAGSAA
jgi:hypothetical protein